MHVNVSLLKAILCADSLTNSIKMLTRSDIILEKRVEANEETARTDASAVNREIARLARAATGTRAAFDDALKNITAEVREGLRARWTAETT